MSSFVLAYILARSSWITPVLQRILLAGLIVVLGSYAALFMLRYLRMWKILRRMPGPSDLFPPWFNLNGLHLQRIYKIDTGPGLFVALCGLTHVFEKQRIFKAYLGFQPVVLCYKPESVEAVLNHSTNLKKPVLYKLLQSWLGTGLLTSFGAKWRIRRKMLTPAFHFRILEDFLPCMNEQGAIFAQCLGKNLNAKIDILPFVTKCTLDIICETAMGVKVGAQKGVRSTYVHSIYTVGSKLLDRAVRPWLWPDAIYSATAEGQLFMESVGNIHQFTQNVIRERKASKIAERELSSNNNNNNNNDCDEMRKRRAFLDLLLDEHFKDPELLPECDIRDEVNTFMFEGHDTTAMALSWCIYLLGHHADVQQKCFEEMDEIFGSDLDREVTPKDLRQMRYLECCIKEALRLYPSVPLIGREVHTAFTVNDMEVPVGSIAFVFPYMLHRDATVFPKPEEFDPDRFLPKNCVGRHPFAYVPFSAGPRNCIGQRFALMEEKVIMSNLLRRYVIRSLSHRDQLELTGEMVLRSKNGLYVSITPRMDKMASSSRDNHRFA